MNIWQATSVMGRNAGPLTPPRPSSEKARNAGNAWSVRRATPHAVTGTAAARPSPTPSTSVARQWPRNNRDAMNRDAYTPFILAKRDHTRQCGGHHPPWAASPTDLVETQLLSVRPALKADADLLLTQRVRWVHTHVTRHDREGVYGSHDSQEHQFAGRNPAIQGQQGPSRSCELGGRARRPRDFRAGLAMVEARQAHCRDR